MPLLTPFVPLVNSAEIFSAGLNTPFTNIYNLINNVGGLGIDSTNVLRLNGVPVNPGQFGNGQFLFGGGLSSSPTGNWYLAAGTNNAPGPGLSAGDISSQFSTNQAYIQMGGNGAGGDINYNLGAANSFAFNPGQAVLFPTATVPNPGGAQPAGNAVPFYLPDGTTPNAELRMSCGQVYNSGGYSGKAVNLSGLAGFSGVGTYIVILGFGENVNGYTLAVRNSNSQFTVYSYDITSSPINALINWMAIGY